jgi:endonuclease/exonuclease/phosphatase (EEP) superfamily protein YafD
VTRILTWNVLHRVHAENHSEPAVVRWPKEVERVNGVVRLIVHALRCDGVEVVLLQEVSGDVVAALRSALPEFSVLEHRYPRVPRQKLAHLASPHEHLVVITPPGSKIMRAKTFENDPGKGVLVVQLPSGLTVASTHVTWGPKGVAQLAVLGRLFEEMQGPTCVGGDFNAERAVVRQAVGREVVISEFAVGSKVTRHGGADIDHLLCKHATLHDAQVLDAHELSDHHPVVATVSPSTHRALHR